MKSLTFLAAGAALLLSACVTVPPGPSIQAMPGSRKTFEQFQADDANCRQFALSRNGAPSDAANNAGVGSAVAGTVIGALIGAAIGGGDGAAVGAGMGLFAGSAAGSANAQATFVGVQRQYDGAYLQCMYASGNRVPVAGGLARQAQMAPQARVAQPAIAGRPAAPGYGPPPNAAIPPPGTPPPDAAIPPPGTPPPSQLPQYRLPN
jgi:outer membrane lipoprotein SlyB